MNPLRRWNSKATSSTSTSNMHNPLVNRTNTQRSAYSTTTAATGATGISNTTFLPEFHSTPPMPTLQKPHSSITGTPTPLRTTTTSISVTEVDTSPTENTIFQRRKSPPPPPQPIFSNIQRTTSSGHDQQRNSPYMLRGCKSTIDIRDRLPNTPEMPAEWNEMHDRALCILDTREYTHEEMVKKVKSSFPELERKLLTPAMLDKQMRIMDQKYDIQYWQVGLAILDEEAEKKKRGKERRKSRSPSKIPRRSTEAGSRPSGANDRTQSPPKNSRKSPEPELHEKNSATELYALMARNEAEELAKINARAKEKKENWSPRSPKSPEKGAFPVRSSKDGSPVIRTHASRSELGRKASANHFNAGKPQR